MKMAERNPNLAIYRPDGDRGMVADLNVPPRCDVCNWRGERCVLSVHEGACIFPRPHPSAADVLRYWWRAFWSAVPRVLRCW